MSSVRKLRAEHALLMKQLEESQKIHEARMRRLLGQPEEEVVVEVVRPNPHPNKHMRRRLIEDFRKALGQTNLDSN